MIMRVVLIVSTLIVLAFVTGYAGTPLKPLKDATETTASSSQRLQLLPWAINRFFDLMKESPSQLKAAIVQLQQDLDGRQVAILFEVKPASSPGEIDLSIKGLEGISERSEREEFAIYALNVSFKNLTNPQSIPDPDETALLTGKALVLVPGEDADKEKSTHNIILATNTFLSGNVGKVIAEIHIVDATWKFPPKATEKEKKEDKR